MHDMLCFGLRWPTLTSARVALRCQGACWGRAFAGGCWIGCLGLGRAFSSTLITIIRAGITLGGCAAELEAAATEPIGNTFLGWITFGVCEGFGTGCAWIGTCFAGACDGLGPKYPVGKTCMPCMGFPVDNLRTVPSQISHDGLIMSWMTSFRAVLQNKFNNMPTYAMYQICVITSRMKFVTHVWQIICNSRHNNFRNSYVL